MREPTAKEISVLRSSHEGLAEDITCVACGEVTRDVLGTFRVNLEVMMRILVRLESDGDSKVSEKDRSTTCSYCGHIVNSGPCQRSHP